jgi:hypothetical protein
VGIATPTGLAGVGLDYSPTHLLSLDCRGGTNLIGPEAACNVRVRPAAGAEQAFYLGAGLSFGPHAQSDVSQDGLFALFTGPFSAMSHTSYGSYRWDLAYFTNLELGHETRLWTGFTMRAYFGLGVLMNPGDGVESRRDYEESVSISNVLAYGGFAFGYARRNRDVELRLCPCEAARGLRCVAPPLTRR